MKYYSVERCLDSVESTTIMRVLLHADYTPTMGHYDYRQDRARLALIIKHRGIMPRQVHKVSI